jgi:hypothetical protein
MEQKTPKRERTLTDSQGREFPVKVLDKELVVRDALVKRVMEKVIKLNERLVADKQKLTEELESYLADLAQRNGTVWKGNAELTSFDDSLRVEIRYKENIRFGVELQLAKQKIDECLKEWTSESNDNLKAIISEAFQVDKKGEIAKYRILALRRYHIKDPKWKEAMELIDKAIQVTSTKQYIAFYRREPGGAYEQVVLNFSSL